MNPLEKRNEIIKSIKSSYNNAPDNDGVISVDTLQANYKEFYTEANLRKAQNHIKELNKSEPEKAQEEIDNLLKSLEPVNVQIPSGIVKVYAKPVEEQADDLSKARSGRYKDTPENRKLGRVGAKYGNEGATTPARKDPKKAKNVPNKNQGGDLDIKEGKHKIPFKGEIEVKYDELAENYSFSGKDSKGKNWSGNNVSAERMKQILSGDKPQYKTTVEELVDEDTGEYVKVERKEKILSPAEKKQISDAEQEIAKMEAEFEKKSVGSEEKIDKIQREIRSLKDDDRDLHDRLTQLNIDMESEAGGKDWNDDKANKYGAEMNKIQERIDHLDAYNRVKEMNKKISEELVYQNSVWDDYTMPLKEKKKDLRKLKEKLNHSDFKVLESK